MDGKMVYATTTIVARDEYTSEYLNEKSLDRDTMCQEFKVGVSPVRGYSKRVKYKDANWMS